MTQDIYQSPKADLHVEQKPSGSLAKSLVLGCAIYIGGTIVWQLTFGLSYGLILSMQGLNQREIFSSLEEIEEISFQNLILTTGILVIAFLAGVYGTRKAGHSGGKAVIILSIVCFAVTVAMLFGSYATYGFLIYPTLTAIAVISGYFYEKRSALAIGKK